jgi:hypothetical protein
MLILMAMRAQRIDSSQATLISVGAFGANLAAVLNGAITDTSFLPPDLQAKIH